MISTTHEPKPKALTIIPASIPVEMRAERRWVFWAYCLRDGKWSQVPLAGPGREAKSNDAATWKTFDEITAAWRPGFDGIGFVLGDGWCGLDFDDVRNQTTGELLPWAVEAIKQLDSYSEVSPSGTGVKIFCKGEKPSGRARRYLTMDRQLNYMIREDISRSPGIA